MSPILNPGGGAAGGGSLPGAAVWRGPFTVTHATPGIATGVQVFVPTVDDLLLDVVTLVPEGWDGTTPSLDYGQIGVYPGGVHNGLWNAVYGAALDLSVPDSSDESALPSLSVGMTLFGLINIPSNFAISGATIQPNYGPVRGYSATGRKFLTAAPFKLCVSQTGATDGGAAGSTTGIMQIYVCTATPPAFA